MKISGIIGSLVLINFLFANNYNCVFKIKNNQDLLSINNFSKCKNIKLDFLLGNFVLNRELHIKLKKNQNLLITGQGPYLTNLYINSKKSGIFIESNYKSTIIIKNITLYPLRRVQYAILLKFRKILNSHKRNVVIKNVDVRFLKNNMFKIGIKIINAWRSLISNVNITSFFGKKFKFLKKYSLDKCIFLENVYSPDILHSNCWSSNYGVYFVSDADPGPEGIFISFSKFVNNLYGIYINLKSCEPEGFIVNNHINSKKCDVFIRNKKFMFIKNNLLYKNKYAFKDFVFFNIEKSNYLLIKDNYMNYPVKIKNYKNIINLYNSKKIHLKDNFIIK